MAKDIRLPNGQLIQNVPDSMSTEEVVTLFENRPARKPLELPAGMETRGQKLEAATGLPFSEQGVPGLGFRFSQSRLERLQDKMAALSRAYPGVQIGLVPASEIVRNPTIIAKLPGEDKFRTIDADQFELADIADIAGTLTRGDVAAPLAASLLIPGAGPAAMAIRAGVAGLAAGSGRLAQEEIDPLLGVSRDLPDINERLREAGQTAIYTGVAQGVGELGNVLVGSPGRFLARTPQEIGDLNANLASIGITEGLTAAETHPFLQTFYQMARRTSGYLQKRNLTRLEQAARFLRDEAASLADPEGLPIVELERLVGKWKTQLLSELEQPISAGPLTAGKTVNRVLRDFTKMREELSNRLYDRAEGIAARTTRRGPKGRFIKLEDVSFDISDAQAEAIRMRHGVRAISSEQPENLGQVNKETGEIVQPKTTRVSRSLQGELNALTRDISQLNPSLRRFTDPTTGQQFSAWAQIRELRNRARNLKDTGDPTIDAQAAVLYDSLVRAMENPVGNNTPGFRAALRAANKAQASTDEFMMKANVRGLIELSDRNPTAAGADLINPRKPDQLRYLREIFTAAKRPDQWDRVRGGYLSRLMEAPETINRELDKWIDKRSLRLVLSEADERTFRDVGKEWEILQQSPVQQLISKQQELGREGLRLLLKGSAEELDRFVSGVGGKDSALGRALRNGVIESIFEHSTELERGQTIVRVGAAQRLIKELRDSGKLQSVLTSRDLERLGYLEQMFSYLPSDMGIATGMQAVSLASSFFRRPSIQSMRAGATLIRNSLLGRLIVSDLVSNVFFTGRKGGMASFLSGKAIRGLAKTGTEIGAAMRLFVGPFSAATRELQQDAAELYGPEGKIQVRPEALVPERTTIEDVIKGIGNIPIPGL